MSIARNRLSAPVAALLSVALGCTSTPATPPTPDETQPFDASEAVDAGTADAALLAADRALAQAVAIADTESALSLMDKEITWTDAGGRTLGRSEMALMLPEPAIEDEGGAEVRRFEYEHVGVVQIDRDTLHSLRVWVRRPAGWRLLVYQEVRSLAAPPTSTPGTGKECVNPCRTVPYEPTSPNERAVIAAYQALEIAAHAADTANWPRYVADEFILVSSNSDRTFDKAARLNGLRQATYGGVSPTELLSARLFDFDTVVVMRSQHRPDRGDRLQITRVWVNRNGTWASTLSYQTSIRAAAATRR